MRKQSNNLPISNFQTKVKSWKRLKKKSKTNYLSLTNEWFFLTLLYTYWYFLLLFNSIKIVTTICHMITISKKKKNIVAFSEY